MRDFVQPRVLKWAALAALATTLLCHPRLSQWAARGFPVWFLELMIFYGAMVLWGFVVAWHARYTQRPVIVWRIEPKWFAIATVAGLVIATLYHLFLDPALREHLPDEYPANFDDWLARLLFNLGLIQLFLVFAPFDWLMRLCKHQMIGTLFTILIGVAVLMMKMRSTPTHLSPFLFSALVCGRFVFGYLAIQCYLRGGVLLAYWFTFILELRHLLSVK